MIKINDLKENDILLINPTGGWDQERESHYFFPIGLLYLKNYLLRHGIPSTIVDIKPQRLSPEKFKKLIEEYNPTVIGYTASPWERHFIIQGYISGIKSIAPDALIVVGGPFFTATANDCLENVPDIDVVVRHEGEITFHELIQAFLQNQSFENIDGIVFRNSDGTIVTNDDRSPSNRDDLEINAEIIPNDDTYSPFVVLKNFEYEGISAIPILLARGCTKKCTFCFNNSYRYRSRTVGSVIDEIIKKRKMFNCDYFWMVDPTFSLRKKFATDLCNALIKECSGVKWYCETRADCDLNLLALMAEAGCVSVDIALESGSPKVLKAIRKDLELSYIFEFTKRCKELGIRVLIFVMYSLPEENIDDFKRTLKVLKMIKSHIYDISPNRALILPGTEMELQAREQGIIPSDFSWFDTTFESIPTWNQFMTREEIAYCAKKLQDYRWLLKKGRLSYFGRTMQTFARNHKILRDFVRANPKLIRKSKKILNID